MRTGNVKTRIKVVLCIPCHDKYNEEHPEQNPEYSFSTTRRKWEVELPHRKYDKNEIFFRMPKSDEQKECDKATLKFLMHPQPHTHHRRDLAFWEFIKKWRSYYA